MEGIWAATIVHYQGSSGHVTKIATNEPARQRQNKGHEQSLARPMPVSGRLRGEKAAGCGDTAAITKPAATTYCRTHRTLCSGQARECQHGDLQLSARNHGDRFKDTSRHVGLQDDERRIIKARVEAPLELYGAYWRTDEYRDRSLPDMTQ